MGVNVGYLKGGLCPCSAGGERKAREVQRGLGPGSRAHRIAVLMSGFLIPLTGKTFMANLI